MQTMCLICERLARWRAGENPYLIHEFTHSIFVVGDHDFFRGYSLLLYKEHVRDLHELPRSVQLALFDEVMTATDAIVKMFHPFKMNHASYGNAEPHIHWHLFPRYDDAYRTDTPWQYADQFDVHRLDENRARSIADLIRLNL
jgi:diadenosine tetraphosphate (Ap4A) HIT family hydrolase